MNHTYVNLKENKIVGLVGLTILTDDSCDECYDPAVIHKPILTRMGVTFDNENTVDVSSLEGQMLINKYDIINHRWHYHSR